LAITNLIEGKKVPVYGDGMQVRDWLFVEDHCCAIDMIVHNGTLGETYCVGGASERANIDIVKRLLTLMDKDEESIEYVTDRPGHDAAMRLIFPRFKESSVGNRKSRLMRA